MQTTGILFTSAGRRNELIRFFRKNCSKQVRIIAADVNKQAPALREADQWSLLPPVLDLEFPGRLLDLCQQEQISQVIPLIDTELPVYAAIKHEFALFGIEIVISNSFAIDLCQDKFSLATFLDIRGYNTPRLIQEEHELNQYSSICLRPRFGSRSVGMRKLDSEEAAKFISNPNFILTEWIDGDEFTIDCLVDLDGSSKITVPRKRITIRDGESIVGETKDLKSLIKLANKVCQSIDGLYGPVNIQGIRNEDGFYITEINPRFAGGITLSLEAGANFHEWFISHAINELYLPSNWKSGKKMFRYWQGIYS